MDKRQEKRGVNKELLSLRTQFVTITPELLIGAKEDKLYPFSPKTLTQFPDALVKCLWQAFVKVPQL